MPIEVPPFYARELIQRLIILFGANGHHEISTHRNFFVELQLNSVLTATHDEMTAIHHFIDLAIRIPTGGADIYFAIRELSEPTHNFLYCFPFVFIRPGLRHYYPCYVFT